MTISINMTSQYYKFTQGGERASNLKVANPIRKPGTKRFCPNRDKLVQLDSHCE